MFNPISLAVLFFCFSVVNAGRLRDANVRITDPIVHGMEEVFRPRDGWARLLLYTPPFHKNIAASAALVVHFAGQLSIHNYGRVCDAYARAAAQASSRLAAQPMTRQTLAGGEAISEDDARRLCLRLDPPDFPPETKPRAMLHSLRLLRDVLPSGLSSLK